MRTLVLASGSGSNFQALVEAQHRGELGRARIVGLVCDRPDAHVLTRATTLHVPASTLEKVPGQARTVYDERLLHVVAQYKPDLIVLAGWMRILTPQFLAAVTVPVVNLHPALPGAYPGLRAMERAFRDAVEGKVQTSGVMVHRVTEVVDAGPVLAAEPVAVRPKEGFEAFKTRMHHKEHQLLVARVRALSMEVELASPLD